MTDFVTVDHLKDHMSGATFTTAQQRDAEVVLEGLQRGIERRLNRRFEQKSYTERVYSDAGGFAMFTRTPVVSITTVDGDSTTDWSGYVSRNGMVGLQPLSWTTVTYVGGGTENIDPDGIEDVRLAILEKAAGIMTDRHDDTVTVKELDTREPERVDYSLRWTEEEVADFDRLRLRVVL